jgi:hypothetical protein
MRESLRFCQIALASPQLLLNTPALGDLDFQILVRPRQRGGSLRNPPLEFISGSRSLDHQDGKDDED